MARFFLQTLSKHGKIRFPLDGNEERVAVERKSLVDFAQTVIRARRRFHEELRKLAAHEFACVVVEGSMRNVMDGVYCTGAHPNAVFGAAISICVDWGVPVNFCGDRQTAKQFVEAYLERCTRAINERDLAQQRAYEKDGTYEV